MGVRIGMYESGKGMSEEEIKGGKGREGRGQWE